MIHTHISASQSSGTSTVHFPWFSSFSHEISKANSFLVHTRGFFLCILSAFKIRLNGKFLWELCVQLIFKRMSIDKDEREKTLKPSHEKKEEDEY